MACDARWPGWAAAVLALASCGAEAEPPSDRAGGIRLLARDDNRFRPDALTVRAGGPVVVRMTSTGTAPHTFTVRELDLDVDVDGGRTRSIEFTPARTGTFEFTCTYHLAAGMVGRLTVLPAPRSAPASPR